MKIRELINEQQYQYEVKKIRLQDSSALQDFADFYNSASQLSWSLTPSRIKQKMGSKGRLWGLYIKGTDILVGTIGLKHIESDGHDLGEMGYTMVDPDHRSLQNIMLLYKEAIKKAKRFDTTFITTNVKNKTINKLLDRTPKVIQLYKIRSTFGTGNMLYVWGVKTSNFDPEIIKQHFFQNIVQEF